MNDQKLSPKETIFVSQYVAGKNAQEAMAAAGYSQRYARKNAYLFLRKPHIAAAIRSAQERIQQQSEMTAEKLLAMFTAAYEKAIEWKQSTGAVRAGEMIGKLTGLIQDKLKLEVEAKPSLKDAIAAGRERAGRIGAAPPLMIDVTTTQQPQTEEK